MDGESILPDAFRPCTLGLFFTVLPGVLAFAGVTALLGVTFGDGFGGVLSGFEGVVFGVTRVDLGSSGGTGRGLTTAVPGDRAGDFAGDFALACANGVDIARVRGAAGTILEFTRVSDSDVYSEMAAERTLLRREAATDGAAGPLRGMGTLFRRDGVVVDLLKDEDIVDVERLGSKNDVGGMGIETLRGAFVAELSRLAKVWGSWDGGTGVALGERTADPGSLGEPLVLRRSGTMVVTPLMLLASDADEKERGLTMPVDDEPAAVERVDARVYRVGVSEGPELRRGGMMVTTTSSAAWARRGGWWRTRLDGEAEDAFSSLASAGAIWSRTNALRLGLEP